MAANTPMKFWGKAVGAIRRDPQKAGVLTVLFVVLLVLQLRLQMSKGDGLSRAVAATAGKGANAASTATKGGAAATPRDAVTTLRAWADAPALPLGRNLFAIDLDRFPQDGNRPPSGNSATQGFWHELAKSMTFRADAKKERQILVENLQQQASQLRLQSTMMGASPKAVVDGALVREGDVVASFRVLKIEARRIVVEREGIKLEIPMK